VNNQPSTKLFNTAVRSAPVVKPVKPPSFATSRSTSKVPLQVLSLMRVRACLCVWVLCAHRGGCLPPKGPRRTTPSSPRSTRSAAWPAWVSTSPTSASSSSSFPQRPTWPRRRPKRWPKRRARWAVARRKRPARRRPRTRTISQLEEEEEASQVTSAQNPDCPGMGHLWWEALVLTSLSILRERKLLISKTHRQSSSTAHRRSHGITPTRSHGITHITHTQVLSLICVQPLVDLTTLYLLLDYSISQTS